MMIFFGSLQVVKNLHIGAAKLGVYAQYRWGNDYNLLVETKRGCLINWRRPLFILAKEDLVFYC